MKNISLIIIFSMFIATSNSQSALIELPEKSLNEWMDLGKKGDSIEIYKISEFLSLPFTTFYLEVEDIADIYDLILSDSTTYLGDSFIMSSQPDIPTASDENLYRNIRSSTTIDSIGLKPVVIHDPIEIDYRRYYPIQVFPFTVTENGQLFKHNNIHIDYKSNEIKQSALLSKAQFTTNAIRKQRQKNASNDSPEFLIITNLELRESFEELAIYRNQVGIYTDLVLIEDILSVYTGRDDAEKLRNYLKEFHNQGGEYILLGGDETVIPIRYAYHNAAYSDISIEEQQVSDLYYADLTGDWNEDNDNVWGEKYSDDVDLTPELYVGRLPFNSPIEVSNYIAKVINYETNRNDINLEYLEKIFIFSSDQMRDYETTGQHSYLSEAFPSNFIIDTTNGIEQSTGEDLNPTNSSAIELESILSSGYGIVNIIAHGSNSTFAVKTSGYNDWPKSYFTTDTNYYGHGYFQSLAKNGNISFYASLGCDNGAFDKDQPPFNQTVPNVVQTLLSLENRGAVGFIANARWGWVSTSYLLQKRFLDYIVANPELPATDAMYKMKDDYYYYRDLILGINYFGDPTMKIYTSVPQSIDFAVNHSKATLGLILSSNGQLLDSVNIVICEAGQIVSSFVTNLSAVTEIDYEFEYGKEYIISAVKHGYTIEQLSYTPSIVTDVDENDFNLPTQFSLNQNYPNPFNPSTSIEFSLPQSGAVSLVVYNTLGQEVAVLVNGDYPAGYHTIDWNGKNKYGVEIASGLYLYKLTHREFTSTRKMLLIR